MRFVKKKYIIIAILAITVAICSVTSSSAVDKNDYTNLKVLPKNISTKELQSIMIDDFEDGLGVSCGFCHAEQKGSHKLDYASDAKPEKKIAREMMEMTLKLNGKFFKVRHAQLGSNTLIVNCATCHHGQPRPEDGGAE